MVLAVVQVASAQLAPINDPYSHENWIWNTQFETSPSALVDTASWQYYPLDIGNAWEYENDSGDIKRIDVMSDTLIDGIGYRIVRYIELGQDKRELVRFDSSTSSIILHLYGVGDFDSTPHCPFDEGEGEVSCARGGDQIVDIEEKGLIVFGGSTPGSGSDSVSVVAKSYDLSSGFRAVYARDVGLVYESGDGYWKALTYYRVGSEEHGIRGVAVSSGYNPYSGNKISIWPNPASHKLKINVCIKSEPGESNIRIYDSSGRIVYEYDVGVSLFGCELIEQDVSSLSAGAYILAARVGGGYVASRQFIVAH